LIPKQNSTFGFDLKTKFDLRIQFKNKIRPSDSKFRKKIELGYQRDLGLKSNFDFGLQSPPAKQSLLHLATEAKKVIVFRHSAEQSLFGVNCQMKQILLRRRATGSLN